MNVGYCPLTPVPAGTVHKFSVLLPKAQQEMTIFFCIEKIKKRREI